VSVSPVPVPRVWHLPAVDAAPASERAVVLGRQAIYRADSDVMGYELLFRAPGRVGLRIDLWNAWQQDRATEHVLAAAFFHGDDVADGKPAFVNFTRSYLVDPSRYLHPPEHIVIEVVESAHADRSLHDRLSDLRGQGYRIAIDDFAGTTSQRELLPLADFVKVDLRDIALRGPGLVSVARDSDASLVAERVETEIEFEACLDAGFDFFQGHYFSQAEVVERSSVAVA
jgi:c-di-GMP-related signal transduction protein